MTHAGVGVMLVETPEILGEVLRREKEAVAVVSASTSLAADLGTFFEDAIARSSAHA